MIKTSIASLEALLAKARENGCTEVKLQLYDNWQEMEKEQKNPAHPVEDYQVDVRYYNTVEFATEIEDNEATDRIRTAVDRQTFVIRVELSDRETLFRTLGIEED